MNKINQKNGLMKEILNKMFSNYLTMVNLKNHGAQHIGQLLWVSPLLDMQIMKNHLQIIIGKNQLKCMQNQKIMKN